MGRKRPAAKAGGTKPAIRQTYTEAVALYEAGLKSLQAHDYRKAADAFRKLLRQYPEEKELFDRAQLYLNVCDRQTSTVKSEPSTVAERLYAATLRLNEGDYSQALSELTKVIKAEPENDHAHYVTAVALTLADRGDEAVAALVRAIDLNADNRALARQDPDLERLRHHERFDAATAPPQESGRSLRSSTPR